MLGDNLIELAFVFLGVRLANLLVQRVCLSESHHYAVTSRRRERGQFGVDKAIHQDLEVKNHLLAFCTPPHAPDEGS